MRHEKVQLIAFGTARGVEWQLFIDEAEYGSIRHLRGTDAGFGGTFDGRAIGFGPTAWGYLNHTFPFVQGEVGPDVEEVVIQFDDGTEELAQLATSDAWPVKFFVAPITKPPARLLARRSGLAPETRDLKSWMSDCNIPSGWV